MNRPSLRLFLPVDGWCCLSCSDSIVGLFTLAYKFFIKLAEFVWHAQATAESDIIVSTLKLVDLSLTANLILIVICSSYENFVSRIDPNQYPRWPEGLFRIGFAGLKQKLLSSIAAIAAVNVLEWFTDIDKGVDSVKLAWVVGILIVFAFAMVLLAIADRLSTSPEGNTNRATEP